MYSYDMYVTFCNTLHPPFLAPLPLAHVALDPEAHVTPHPEQQARRSQDPHVSNQHVGRAGDVHAYVVKPRVA
jgi:hypothetical protein